MLPSYTHIHALILFSCCALLSCFALRDFPLHSSISFFLFTFFHNTSQVMSFSIFPILLFFLFCERSFLAYGEAFHAMDGCRRKFKKNEVLFRVGRWHLQVAASWGFVFKSVELTPQAHCVLCMLLHRQPLIIIFFLSNFLRFFQSSFAAILVLFSTNLSEKFSAFEFPNKIVLYRSHVGEKPMFLNN